MEDAIKVAEEATVVENSKDGAPMDVDADADAVKVSKRKQTGWVFFLHVLVL